MQKLVCHDPVASCLVAIVGVCVVINECSRYREKANTAAGYRPSRQCQQNTVQEEKNQRGEQKRGDRKQFNKNDFYPH